MIETDEGDRIHFDIPVHGDERLEALSEKVRRGIPVDFKEALEVIAYQEVLKANRPKTWWDRVKAFFHIT